MPIKFFILYLSPKSPALRDGCPLNVSLKNFFVYHLNSMKIGKVVSSYLCVLKLHQVSLNLNENQKRYFITHLMDGLSIKGRWIRPYSKNVHTHKMTRTGHLTCHYQGQICTGHLNWPRDKYQLIKLAFNLRGIYALLFL